VCCDLARLGNLQAHGRGIWAIIFEPALLKVVNKGVQLCFDIVVITFRNVLFVRTFDRLLRLGVVLRRRHV
jgi:hypothetical protein